MELLRCCFVATDGIAVSVVVAADAVAATEVVVGCWVVVAEVFVAAFLGLSTKAMQNFVIDLSANWFVEVSVSWFVVVSEKKLTTKRTRKVKNCFDLIQDLFCRNVY